VGEMKRRINEQLQDDKDNVVQKTNVNVCSFHGRGRSRGCMHAFGGAKSPVLRKSVWIICNDVVTPRAC